MAYPLLLVNIFKNMQNNCKQQLPREFIWPIPTRMVSRIELNEILQDFINSFCIFKAGSAYKVTRPNPDKYWENCLKQRAEK